MADSKQLLVIDDDPDYVDGITGILRKEGYQVDVAYNPKDGYAKLEKGAYDLLLLDIMMGRGAEGVMLARKMRKDPRLREMPVLIITSIREQLAFLFPGQPVHPHFTAHDELIEKPVEPQLLLEKVSLLLTEAEQRAAGTAVPGASPTA
jgi:CheY-like chemotaxis protein